jgi:hypothetical protein
MDYNAYEEGHAGLINHVHVKAPIWLKELAYTNCDIGLYAIIDLTDLFKTMSFDGNAPFIMRHTVLKLTPNVDTSDFGLFAKLTNEQWYMLFENSQTKLTIVRGVPIEQPDKRWTYHISGHIESPSKDALVQKKIYFSRYITVCRVSYTEARFPNITKPYTTLVNVSGDADMLHEIMNGPTIQLKKQKSTLEWIVGSSPELSPTSNTKFGSHRYFGKIKDGYGKSKLKPSEIEALNQSFEQHQTIANSLSIYEPYIKDKKKLEDDYHLL